MFEQAEFDWDAGNTLKCQKHGLSIEEIEALFANNPRIVLDECHSQTEKRLVAIGMSRSGKAVFVGFTIRAHGTRELIRPITARFMRDKEFLRYAGRPT